jgi:dipeptidyl-peptidase 4
MKKLIFQILILFITVSAFAQQKELSLEDAVLKRFTTLGPERLPDLQWVKNTSMVSWQSKDRDKIMIRKPGTRAPIQEVSLTEINSALSLELKKTPSINWLGSGNFYFKNKGIFYTYSISSKTGKTLLTLPESTANVDYHAESNHAAFTRDNNLFVIDGAGKEHAVTSFNDPNIVSGQEIARQEFGISKGTFWSPKGNLLAFYQKDESDVADYPLLDITTTPGSLKTIKYPMAGQKSQYAKVGIYDVKTDKFIYLKIDGPKDQYLTNLGWGPEERFVYIAVVNRDQNHMRLNKYDISNGNLVKTLFEEKHAKYVEPENPVWFLPTIPNEFYWMSERDGFMHVYHYNTDGELLGQVTKGNWVVLEILGFDEKGKNLIVKGTDESGLNTYAYAVNLKKGDITQIPTKAGKHSFQLSSDGKNLIDSWSNLKTPSVVDVINLKGKKIENLLTSANPLKDVKIGTTELLDIKAKDGTTLHARMIKPSDFDPSKKYKVLVYVYGGPHAQMVSNRWLAGAPLWMHYMAEKGYIIFTVDNRGSSNRGFEFENVIHRQLGVLEMEDQLAGVDYLQSLPYVDRNKMAVHGWSYGGFMTTSLMLRHPGTFEVGVAGGPVTDWKYYEVMYGERYMDRPEENPEGYKKARVLNYVKNLKGNLLLIHGTSDPVVVMQHNLALVKAFVDEGIQVDFFPYPMHPHNVRGKDRVHLMTKVLDYIDENLKKERP